MTGVDNLTTEQRDEVLRFVLARMGPETRRELMAALPVPYVRMYPTTADVVFGAVREAIEK